MGSAPAPPLPLPDRKKGPQGVDSGRGWGPTQASAMLGFLLSLGEGSAPPTQPPSLGGGHRSWKEAREGDKTGAPSPSTGVSCVGGRAAGATVASEPGPFRACLTVPSAGRLPRPPLGVHKTNGKCPPPRAKFSVGRNDGLTYVQISGLGRGGGQLPGHKEGGQGKPPPLNIRHPPPKYLAPPRCP